MASSFRFVFLTVLCSPSPASASGDGRLASPIKLPLRSPVAVSTGDFNGDGRPEIVTAAFENKVSILWRVDEGIERWVARPGPAAKENSFFVRAADFNHDGNDDLVVCDLTAAGFAYVFKSRGDGLFEEPAVLKEAVGPRWATIADFNADGDLDIATANVQTRTFSVFLGGGDGSFTHIRTRTRDDGSPHSIEALDFNGDGAVDLCSGMSEVGILPVLGDGRGGLTQLKVFNNLGGPRYLATGDFDRDGKGDLATSLGLAGTSRGDATFGLTVNPGFPQAIIFPSIADFDGDGLEDVAFSFTGEVSFHRGNGDGTFQGRATSSYVSQFPYFATERDLDGDGWIDLVSVDIDSSAGTIFRGTSGPSGFENEPRVPHLPATCAVLLDVIDDGAPDLLLFSLATQSLHIHAHPDRKLNRPAPDLELPFPELIGSLEPVDLDDDGRLDLVGVGLSVDLLLVALLDGSGKIGGTKSFLTGRKPMAALPARLGEDALPDVLVPCKDDSRVDIFRGKGGLLLEPAESVPSISAPVAVAVGDLNADAWADLVVAGGSQAAVHLATSDGKFEGPTLISEDLGRDYVALQTGDRNLDGALDLALLAAPQGIISLREGKGNGEFGAERILHEREGLSTIAFADLDADEFPELLAASGPGGSLLVIGSGDAEGSPPPAHYQAVKSALGIRTADLNQDGALDVAVIESLQTAVLLGRPRFDPASLFRRGDASGSGRVDITDSVLTLVWLFQGGVAPSCQDAADTNDDGAVDLTDAINALRWLFQGGEPPSPPGPITCGTDPTADELPDCLDGC